MKRPVRSALVGLSLLLAPSAFALSTAVTYDLRIEGTPVGRMALRNRVIESTDGLTCEYTGRWTGLAGALTRTRLCRLGEYKASDHFDCEENRRTFFTTLVSAPEGGCAGFDEWGQATDIRVLVAGESPRGELFGIILTESLGDVQSFEMGPEPVPQNIEPLPPASDFGLRIRTRVRILR